jgi:flagellar hook-associated protein 3 FlgL
MAVGTILTGRTTNSLQARRLIANVQRDQTDLARLQEQVSTGQRLLLPSDDPLAASQIFSLRLALAHLATFQNNNTINQGYLSVTDQALGTVGDALNQAKALAQSGLGDTVSASERSAIADQVASLIQTVSNAGNSQYNGRYLFGGSFGTAPPFSDVNGFVRYNGDGLALQTFADYDFTIPNNLDGLSAFAGWTAPVQTRDLDPALTLAAPLSDLRGGAGIVPGPILVTVSNGGPAVTKTVDLTGAATLQDVKTRIENAFAAESVTVSVGIDPATKHGLEINPSAGTIAIQDVAGFTTATALGIASSAASSIAGADLDPKLSLFTPVASLNGGTGIGATAGTGLKIVNGHRTSIVDLNGAATIQDVLNRIRAADPDVSAEISPDGKSLAISSRLSGADFSIGENGGTNATNLGIRTFNGSTLLSDLNYGTGVPFDQTSSLTIQRRNGTTVTVDVAGSATIQDVLDKINVVDPGHLAASLNSIGNGISLTDDSGSGTLTVADSELSRRLGISGSDSGGVSGVLAGKDVNPRQPSGALNILVSLEKALRTGDNQTLNRLLPRIDAEVNRVSSMRALVGSRQKLMDAVQNQLGEVEISNKELLSKVEDADLPTLISELMQKQQTLQATLQIASRMNQLSILDYL